MFMQDEKPLWSIGDGRHDDDYCMGQGRRFLDIPRDRLADGIGKRLHDSCTALDLPKEVVARIIVDEFRAASEGAALISVSASKVEDLHAQHREKAVQSGQVPALSTVASMSVQRQATARTAVALKHLLPRDVAPLEPLPTNEDASMAVVPVVTLKAYKRFQPAARLFSYDWKRTQLQLGTFHNMTDEGFEELAMQAWKRASDAEREQYEHRSSLTKHAKHMLALTDSAPTCGVPSSQCSGAVGGIVLAPMACGGGPSTCSGAIVPYRAACDGAIVPYSAACDRATKFQVDCQLALSCPITRMAIVSQNLCQIGREDMLQLIRADGDGDDVDCRRPLHPALFSLMAVKTTAKSRRAIPTEIVPFLEQLKNTSQGFRPGLKALAESMKKHSVKIAPSTATGEVVYPKVCKGLCGECSTAKMGALFDGLLGVLSSIVKVETENMPMLVCKYDVVIAVELTLLRPINLKVFHVVDAVGQSGEKAPAQLCHRYSPIRVVAAATKIDCRFAGHVYECQYMPSVDFSIHRGRRLMTAWSLADQRHGILMISASMRLSARTTW